MDIAQNLQQVRAAIADVARRAGRDPASVSLLAVSKLQPAAAVLAALRAGQQDFGENYAQELRDKSAEIAAAAPQTSESGPRWHYIGPLQRNKVRLVVGRARLIHTIDDADLLAEVARRARAAGLTQDCLVQVNLGDESQKAGCAAQALPALLEAFTAAEGAVRCLGLMCIPPAADDPEAARPFFRRLRELRDEHGLRELSMGMSHDFAVAITEGATLVRVGTAIFGARPA